MSLKRAGQRYVWDSRPGQNFLEWWEGLRRRREAAGRNPSEVLEARRRKLDELPGMMVAGEDFRPAASEDSAAVTPIGEAAGAFLRHVEVHSPDKPRTLARYRAVLDHFVRLLGHKQWVELIQRADIEQYKTERMAESARGSPNRGVMPSTVNFEVSVLRTMAAAFRRESRVFFRFKLSARIAHATPRARQGMDCAPRSWPRAQAPVCGMHTFDRKRQSNHTLTGEGAGA